MVKVYLQHKGFCSDHSRKLLRAYDFGDLVFRFDISSEICPTGSSAVFCRFLKINLPLPSLVIGN